MEEQPPRFLNNLWPLFYLGAFMESWIAPGPDPRNWTQRSLITASGILETSPAEFSLYVNEHYQWDDSFIRRYTVRRHGFGLEDCDVIFGNELDKMVTWKGKGDVSRLRGRPARLMIGLKDADLFAFRFGG